MGSSLPRELCFCCTDESSGIRNKFASLNLTHSFGICSEYSSREGCPRKLAHSPNYSQWALDLGRILSMLTARLPELSRFD